MLWTRSMTVVMNDALWATVDVEETVQYTSAPVTYAAAPASETLPSTGHAREAAVPFPRTCAEVGHRDDKAYTGWVDEDANLVFECCRSEGDGSLKKVVVSTPVLEIQAGDVAAAASMPLERLSGRGGTQARMELRNGVLWKSVDGAAGLLGLVTSGAAPLALLMRRAQKGVFWASRPPCAAPLALLLRRAQKCVYWA